MRRIFVLGVVSMLVGALSANALVLPGSDPAAAASPVTLGANATNTQEIIIPPPTGPGTGIHQSVGAADLLTGREGWVFGIVNKSGDLVADPAITVSSGWSPSMFAGLTVPPESACPSTATRQGSAFPYTWSDASLPLGLDDSCYLASWLPDVLNVAEPPGVIATEQDLQWGGGDTSAAAPPISFRPGYDSFRDVDKTTVAPGDAQQVTVGFTARDASITTMVVDLWSLMTPESIAAIALPTDVPDCTTASDPGETCFWWWDTGPRPELGGTQHAEVILRNPVLGRPYEYLATFTNEGDAPVSMIPAVHLLTPRTFESHAPSFGTSVQVEVPGLDGGTAGSGAVDFSIGADQAAAWTATTTEFRWVIYSPANFPLSYAWSGFFAPVDNGVLNTARAGSSIPVKFSLGGDLGLDIFAAGYPRTALVTCDGSMPTDLIETYATGASSLAYDPGTGRYVYVWKTDRAWSNTCRQLQVMLADGSLHTALFSFR